MTKTWTLDEEEIVNHMLDFRFVWALQQHKGEREYWVTFDIRDYKNNYCRMVPIPKSFLINLIKAMDVQENIGLRYKKFQNFAYQEGDHKS
jgi:hypothetical protein